jgi:hypothetical protein
MKKLSNTYVRLAVFLVVMVSLVVVVGCSRGPNAKQLKALEDQRAATLAAEQKASDCAGEKAKIEKQLAEQKQKLEAMKQEKVAVQKRLASM